MKKYLILTLATVSIILTVIGTGHTCVNNINTVDGTEIYRTSAHKQQNITGRVQLSDTDECTAVNAGIVQYVSVSEGDHVHEGDIILIAAESGSELDLSKIYRMMLSKGGDTDLMLENMIEDLSVVTYKAGITGTINNVAEEGGVYTKGKTLFSISPAEESFEIVTDVSESNIMHIRTGQNVVIKTRAFDRILNGTVKEIDDHASQTGGNMLNGETTVRVKISVDSDTDELKPGYTAECRVITETKENALVVPYSSVGRDSDGNSYVYVFNGNKCGRTDVLCGGEYNEGIEITQGLSEGDVIANDISMIDDTKENLLGEVSAYGQ